MGNRTPLYQMHVDAGARMVDFGGWDMPVYYGSQLDEHHAVRNEAGMFDVSHMTVVDVSGPGARDALRYLLSGDVDRLAVGRALYSCMLNEDGGVVDDLIVYRRDEGYRMVVNAATREQDLQWISEHTAGFDARFVERDGLAMLAVQGPRARERVLELIEGSLADRAAALEMFHAAGDDELFVARTGYTGEDGFELIMPAAAASHWWRQLAAAGVHPCGLGARDTLRLEAGLNLYGTDMTMQTSPLESALGWTVAWEPAERDFIGRAALEKQRAAGVERRLTGLVLAGRGVLRNHLPVRTDAGEGEITSGSFSPTLGRAIALARVPAAAGSECEVQIRGQWKAARLVRPPFVRHGRILVDLV